MEYTPEQILAVAQRGREIDHEIQNYSYFRPWDKMHEGTQKMYVDMAEAMMLALDELRKTW